MPGALIGAALGWAFSSTIIGWGLAATVFGAVMIGASLGSLFDAPSLDMGGTTPNYNFGPLSNTKTQLLPVPIVYGRCRVGGNIFLQRFHDDKKEKIDMEQNQKRLRELREQISEKKYYNSEALRMVL